MLPSFPNDFFHDPRCGLGQLQILNERKRCKATTVLDPACDSAKRFSISRHQDEPSTLLRHRLGDRLSDAAAGSRDDRYLVFESGIHLSFFSLQVWRVYAHCPTVAAFDVPHNFALRPVQIM